MFDVNTLYKHENVLGDNTFVFDEDEFFLSWDNEYLGNGKVRLILDMFFAKESFMKDIRKIFANRHMILKRLKTL